MKSNLLTALLILFSLALLASCGTGWGPGQTSPDFKSQIVTAENSAQMAADAKSALTFEEYELVQAYVKRVNPELPQGQLPVGVTIGAMLESQKAFLAAGQVPAGTLGQQAADSGGNTPAESPATADKPSGTATQPAPAKETPRPAAPQASETPASSTVAQSGSGSDEPAGSALTKTEPATPPPPTTAVVPSGTAFEVRLTQALSSATARNGETFSTVLDRDLVVEDYVLAKAGSVLTGKVTDVAGAGKVKGKAHMTIRLIQLQFKDTNYDLVTDPLSFEAQGTEKKDAVKIGVAAGVGTLIGAIAGGKKGAAIGAAVGGGTGTGVVLATKGDEVDFPSEQLFSFQLAKDLELPILAKP